MIKLLKGDCLEVMKSIESGSVDAVITDPPYGTTACKWDSVIDFKLMWEQLNRIIKPKGVVVLFGSQPFTSSLIMSNPKMFKYEWIWKKNTGTGFAAAKYQPLKYHENIIVFANGKTTYNPMPTERFSEASKKVCKKPVRGGGKKTSNHLSLNIVKVQYDSETKNPESVLNYKSVPNGGGKKLHSTQKPVALMEYLIKTYTNENETVLDFTMGSGSTGVAAINTNRQFVGIEQDENYYNIAVKRIKDAEKELNKLTLFK